MIRKTSRFAIAGLASLLAVVIGSQGSIVTSAAWQDSEYASAQVGTLDCADPAGQFQTRGEGQLLSGSLLGIDLDDIAEVQGVLATNDGDSSTAVPSSAQPLGEDAYANPFDVKALSSLSIPLTDVLALPLDTDTGVIGQYGQATNTGTAAGASGLITESGGIALEPTDGYPDLATLQLSELLASVNPLVSATLEPVADVSLEVGAVTGRAELNACDLDWSQNLSAELSREYLTSSVDTVIDSPTVGGLVDTVDGVVENLDSIVAGLADRDGLTDTIGSSLTGLLGGLLGALRLGDVSVSLTAGIDLDPVRELLTEEFSDSSGVLTVNLAAGEIRVDTAALLGAAYPGEYGDGLNNLPPNSNLLEDPAVLTALTDTLTSVLQEWLDRVTSTLKSAVDRVTINVTANIDIKLLFGLLPVATINVGVSGSLADLLGGASGFATAEATVLGILDLRLLDPLLGALVSGAGLVVGTAVNGVLGPMLNTALNETLSNVLTPVIDAVSTVYNALFLSGIVSLTVNAQNDPLSGGPEPSDWQGLQDGQYDVAALRIGVLDAAQEANVALYLGRGSVGPHP